MCFLRCRADRPAKPLPVGYEGAVEVDALAESLAHGGFESGQLLVHGGAVLGQHGFLQVEEQSAKASDDLGRSFRRTA